LARATAPRLAGTLPRRRLLSPPPPLLSSPSLASPSRDERAARVAATRTGDGERSEA
jgi:hypothetical protein